MRFKRVISTILAIVVACFACGGVLAVEGMNSDPNAPDLYDAQRLEQVNGTNQKIDAYIAMKQNTRSSSSNGLAVPLYQQELTYYCGPACVQMAVSYITGTKYSQSTLANYMNTSSNGGTYVYQIRNGLNAYTSAGAYEYVTTSESSFSSSLIYSVDHGKPVICHVMTGGLPNYSGASNTGHYIVARAYYVAFSGSSYTTTCQYNDPHYNSNYYGIYTCDMTVMLNAINANAGYFIRGT